jgi:fatty-acyl-CoA synthase
MTKPNKNLSEWIDVIDDSDLMSISLGDLIDSAALKFPQAEALVYSNQPDISDIRWTYEELSTMSTNLAKGFLDSGLNPGETVGVWGPNHPEWILAEYALAKAGLRMVTLNPLYKEQELIFALNTVNATALIHADEIAGCQSIELIQKAMREIPSLQHLHSFDTGLKKLIKIGGKASVKLPEVSPKDIFMIQYTSGTTGTPKAAQMTHEALITSAKNSHMRWEITDNQKVCHGFPLFHIGGSACMTLGAASMGAVSLPLYVFKPNVTLDIIEKEQCSMFIGAPVHLTAMLEDPNFKTRDLSSLKCIVVGGSNPPVELLKRFSKEFNADVINGYGMTETCGLSCSALPSDTPELKAIAGLPLPGVSMRVVNEHYEIVPNNETGELLYKGPGLMSGYGNLPDGSSGINDDGWFPTGDLATMNANGYINIVGRAKEMIIRGGENLYPIEIENYLLEHPAIFEVAVFGLPDSKYDEECCAVARVDQGQLNDPEQLRDWCKDRISRWKIPRYIFFTDSFPTTPSGKIQKYKLQEKYIKLITEN